jgi:hypothetical protein
MKLTIYIEDVYFEHETITDPKEIARVVKSHITHLGKVSVYYQKPIKNMIWWRRLILYSIGRTK